MKNALDESKDTSQAVAAASTNDTLLEIERMEDEGGHSEKLEGGADVAVSAKNGRRQDRSRIEKHLKGLSICQQEQEPKL